MLQEELWERMRALPLAYMAPTLVSVSHARALHLVEGVGEAEPDHFQAGREFAHLHPHSDGSLHLSLPEWVKEQAVEAGWGERHPVQNALMVYGPRDRFELEVAWTLVQLCYQWALDELE
ncbi:luciferase family protein [Nocardioides sp. CN2-186]|uniref:luciferase domain-containing protein n=1 Tax=Nocardioides tweenelious TaxID=3156607 RepID=UPI0032B363E8